MAISLAGSIMDYTHTIFQSAEPCTVTFKSAPFGVSLSIKFAVRRNSWENVLIHLTAGALSFTVLFGKHFMFDIIKIATNRPEGAALRRWCVQPD